MKRVVYTITLAVAALMITSATANGQEKKDSKATEEKQKQKESEVTKKVVVTDQEALKKAELDAKMKQAEAEFKVQEDAMKKQQAEIEKAMKTITIVRDDRDLERVREKAEQMSRNAYVFEPGDGNFRFAVPDRDIYLYNGFMHNEKAGSSWNYSRQVLESTFSSEFTMDAGDSFNDVNLTVSGDCAEGSISVAIILPDGKQLSEVVIDANGSLNWRKSFKNDEADGWKNGKWMFRINAKNATGNFRISMSAY